MVSNNFIVKQTRPFYIYPFQIPFGPKSKRIIFYVFFIFAVLFLALTNISTSYVYNPKQPSKYCLILPVSLIH